MYNYQTEKPKIFTEDRQRMFLAIRDKVHQLIAQAGCVRMQEATSKQCGDSWQMLACVDRLVELGEIREVPQAECAGQHRIFIK